MTDSSNPPRGADYEQTLNHKRAEKDEFLQTHRQSPIPPEKRDSFEGLDYFAPDTAYRVDAAVTRFENPAETELRTSDDRTVTYNRVFEFSFDLRGNTHTLSGYRQQPEDAIFVPFRDKTTGQQTYKDGRYIELNVAGELSDGDSITVDFNLAYSPFCAYSETFSCPLPPETNWLDVVVEAGEKVPSF